jgi:hypothetical protein
MFTHGISLTALRHCLGRALARQLATDEIHPLLAGIWREQRILLNSIRSLTTI